MKVLGGAPGKLAEDYDRAFRFALSCPGVACVLIGAGNADQVRRAVRAAREFRPLSQAEMDAAVESGKQLVRAGTSISRILERHEGADFGSHWS